MVAKTTMFVCVMVVAVLYLTGLLHILENYDMLYFNNNYYPYDEVTGDQRKVHNEELNDLYCSLNIVWVSKSTMECAGHVTHKGGEERCIQGFGVETWGKETTWKTQV